MAKIKFTKGEQKKQRDSLRQFERFLPILQLKKQQLQAEILRMDMTLEEKKRQEQHKRGLVDGWAQLLGEPVDLKRFFSPRTVETQLRNVAGIDIRVFERVGFPEPEFDLFLEPLWLDRAVDELRELAALMEEIAVLEAGTGLLRQELRVTTQRVNLFEKVKIPEAKDAIRRIKIYMGDQMANAVGRSKIAKKKIEAAIMQEAGV